MGRVLAAALFIAGICIGIAYFTIPILTGIIGFIPGVAMTILVWVFTLAISLLYAEATLTQPDGSNLPTISKALLGKTWMVILTVIFIINVIAYLASYAYITAEFMQWFFQTIFHMKISPLTAELLSTVPYALIVFLGVRFSFRIDVLLMIGLLISFALMCFQGGSSVVPSRLLEQNWTYIVFSVPILFSALGFAGIVPVICTYLNRNPRKIIWALVSGSVIPLIVYIIWQWFMLGSFPEGQFWILYEKGADIEAVIAMVQTIPSIVYALNFLVFFSMITSLVGNGIAMIEFLFDLFKKPLEQRTGWPRLGLSIVIFGLTLLAALYKGQFLTTLIGKIIAPLGAILINGMIPVFMVVQSRYVHKVEAPRMLGGGKTALGILGLCLMILIYLEGVEFISS